MRKKDGFVVTTLRLSEHLWLALRREALDKRTSATAIVEDLVRKHFREPSLSAPSKGKR